MCTSQEGATTLIIVWLEVEHWACWRPQLVLIPWQPLAITQGG